MLGLVSFRTWTSKIFSQNSLLQRGIRKRLESTMRNILHVAEKNDAAKNISAIMARGNSMRREGFSRFNKIYQFNYNFQGQNCNMIMTSVSGHLLNQEFPAAYRGWNSCNPVDLFSAPVIKGCSKDMENIKRTLEREVRQCDLLVIWTDCDREGENIGFEIINVCKAVKPNIRVMRAKFSQITNQAITRAITNLIQPDKKVSDAVDVRSELDLRIGASFTRFQTMRLKKLFPTMLTDSVISYGSCQFPTLGFVVERYRSIQDFINENFWKIEVTHDKDGVSVKFNWDEGELFDEAVATSLFEACQDVNLATVEKVESKPKSKWRPVPLDTVELEKLGSTKLKINAAQTMKIAEKLYTQGFISYPRTETNIFPKDLALTPLVEMQTNDPNWGDFATRVLQDGPNPRQGKKSDQAHPPIHPTKYTNSLQGNEQKIYEFIVRHFLACVSKDAKGHETKVEISIGEEKFHGRGLMVLERNYLEVYVYERWSDMEIPVYQVGEQFVPTTLELKEGETSAPNLLTEAELIALMEKHGIGTDATHAEHIETIKKRNYASLTPGDFFIPQQLGMALVEGYDSMGFHMSKPYLRSELEADLKRICEGQKSPQEVLQEQVAKYKEVFEQTVAQVNKLDTAVEQHLGIQREANVVHDIPPPIAQQKFAPCPSCGQDMVLKQKRDGETFFVSCSSFPGCRSSLWFPASIKEASISDQTCQRCGPNTKLLKFKFRRGDLDVFYPTLELTTCVMGCDRQFYDNLDIRGFRQPGPARPAVNAGGDGPDDDDDDFGGGPPGGGGGGGPGAAGGTRNARTGATVQPANINRPTARAQNVWNIGPMGDFGLQDEDQSNNITCSCQGNPPAASRTVRKEGANKGRQFWGCDKPMGQGCGFFKWADEVEAQQNVPSNNRTNPRNPPPNPPPFNPVAAGNSDAQDIMCTCGSAANMMTVRKDGPNQGRPFWRCGTGANCGFFQWADEDPPAPSQTNSYAGNQSMNPPRRPLPTQPTGNPDDQDIMCSCSTPATMKTVRKEGANQGRQFWSCGTGANCGFFQWADEDPPARSQTNSYAGNQPMNPPRRPPPSQPAGNSDDQDIMCSCSTPATMKTVRKEGANQGRQFWSCGTGANCGFFQWADEDAPPQNQNIGGRGNHNQQFGNNGFNTFGGGRGNTGGGATKRKCSSCHQEGHTKRTCPQRRDY